MYNKDLNNKIVISRGDTAQFKWTLNEDLLTYIEEHDITDSTIYFGAFQPNYIFEDSLIKKVLNRTNIINKELIIKLNVEDTLNLTTGLYYYQIKVKLTRYNEEVNIETSSQEFNDKNIKLLDEYLGYAVSEDIYNDVSLLINMLTTFNLKGSAYSDYTLNILNDVKLYLTQYLERLQAHLESYKDSIEEIQLQISRVDYEILKITEQLEEENLYDVHTIVESTQFKII